MQFPRITLAFILLIALSDARAQTKVNSVKLADGKTVTATTNPKSNEWNGARAGTFTDARDGQEYKYVTIGSQTWMAENLNYAVEGSWCIENDTSKCATYGRLYNWKTLMNGARSSATIPSGVQGICPNGWHVPSDGEWEALLTIAGGADFAGDKLKCTSGWSDDGNGSNEFGFCALPGGFFYESSFEGVGDKGFWWSSTKLGMTPIVWIRIMQTYEMDVQRGGYGDTYGLSLRCLKDGH